MTPGNVASGVTMKSQCHSEEQFLVQLRIADDPGDSAAGLGQLRGFYLTESQVLLPKNGRTGWNQSPWGEVYVCVDTYLELFL